MSKHKIPVGTKFQANSTEEIEEIKRLLEADGYKVFPAVMRYLFTLNSTIRGPGVPAVALSNRKSRFDNSPCTEMSIEKLRELMGSENPTKINKVNIPEGVTVREVTCTIPEEVSEKQRMMEFFKSSNHESLTEADERINSAPDLWEKYS